MRRLIVDLRAEHPALNLSEVSRISYARYGRRPDEKTVGRVLQEEHVPPSSTAPSRGPARPRHW